MEEQSHPSRFNKPWIISIGLFVIVAACVLAGFYLGMGAWHSLDKFGDRALTSRGKATSARPNLTATQSVATLAEAGTIYPEPISHPTATATPQKEAQKGVVTLAPIFNAACEKPERVLIISVDGLRPEPIWEEKVAPYILQLADQAAYTWSAQTVRPSITIPGHLSMLSGYDVPTHGVVLNSIWQTPEAKAEVVTIFQRAKEAGMVTVLIAGKKHFYYFERAGYLDYHLVDPAATDLKIGSDAVDYIKDNDFDLMFVHFANVDEAGHAYTWMSPEYLAAVGMADNAVRMVIRALEAKDILKNTLVIITSDHGGTGDSHSDASVPTNRTIPWMVLGPCVRAGRAITGEVRIFDTAAIALWGLGIEIPADFDGRIVSEAFESSEAGVTATAAP